MSLDQTKEASESEVLWLRPRWGEQDFLPLSVRKGVAWLCAESFHRLYLVVSDGLDADWLISKVVAQWQGLTLTLTLTLTMRLTWLNPWLEVLQTPRVHQRHHNFWSIRSVSRSVSLCFWGWDREICSWQVSWQVSSQVCWGGHTTGCQGFSWNHICTRRNCSRPRVVPRTRSWTDGTFSNDLMWRSDGSHRCSSLTLHQEQSLLSVSDLCSLLFCVIIRFLLPSCPALLDFSR